MANEPVIFKENKSTQLITTRQDFMNENNRKYGGSGKFSFRKYKTDKERILEYLQEKESNESQIHSQAKKAKAEEIKRLPSVEQPIMRFKPRTDLERIYYSINDYSFGKVPKEVIEEQLKKLNLNEVKKKEEEANKDAMLLSKFENIDEKAVEELQTQKDFLNKQGYSEKNSETVKQISMILENYHKQNVKHEDDPSRFQSKHAWRSHVNKKAAKKLMGEYNKKTHFKAASVYSFHLDDYKNTFNGSNNISYNFPSHFANKKNSRAGKTLNYFYLQRDADKQAAAGTTANFLSFHSFDEPDQDEKEQNKQLLNLSSVNNPDASRGLRNLSQATSSNNFYKVSNFPHNSAKTANIRENRHLPNPRLTSLDFNPLVNKKEQIYDPKNLVYLKNISQSNSIADINSNKSKGIKNLGFLSNLKRKTMNILSMKNDNINNFLNQLSTNDMEDMRKCK